MWWLRRLRPVVLILLTLGCAAPSGTGISAASRPYPPLSRNSLHWLSGSEGNGFSLLAPTASPRVPERVAVSRAVIAASVAGASVRVLEVGLKAVQMPPKIIADDFHPYLTSGNTYWVLSVMPQSRRVIFRWFFVLVDARTGNVSDMRYIATFRRPVPVHVTGERPLATPRNISTQELASRGYLFEAPRQTPKVSRAQALRVARRDPGIPGGVASPARGRAQTILLARVWTSTSPLLQTQPLQWVIVRPAHERALVTHKRLSVYALIFIDAVRGTRSESMCCVLARHPF